MILTDASIAGLPLLIPLTPEPVFAVEATRTPVRAQSFTTPDTVTGTVMVRGDYTVAVTPPPVTFFVAVRRACRAVAACRARHDWSPLSYA
ncbi:hypothetical protein [uncultured Microbacterium sp.]|uniref:hypothetical protein n=1 Tax=uncultured Microbacterium sp. TaxID=191216 RepID=UPI002633FEAB|nr:hypothetical protein [uncultured Microbacterium sp.]